MIEGLNFDISSAEMKVILKKSGEHHAARVLFYRDKLVGFDSPHASNSTDPASDMRRSLDHHKNEVIKFRFLLEHVIPNETYRLTEAGLRSIGVIPNRY